MEWWHYVVGYVAVMFVTMGALVCTDDRSLYKENIKTLYLIGLLWPITLCVLLGLCVGCLFCGRKS